MDNRENNNIYFLVSTLLIIFDQSTKLAVKGFNLFGWQHEGMYYGESIPIWGTFLQLTYIENPGMAFGIEFGWGKIFLSLFSIFASIALGYYLYKITFAHKAVKIGISLVFAGAVGNLIDRVFYGVFYGTQPLFYGHVVDFIQVDIPDINFMGIHYTHFPIFNIADSCVTCGIILLILFHNKLPGIKEILGKNTQIEDLQKENAGEQ
ncbi:MAG TPA: signal peptidase II [Candidatus Kapabacteria bacterium]|jgi:signal peptidase II|nr:signal peptidase II [Candidatus Kapabacteria bacterium]HOM03952.1 signal peptidase II [Candidatus Kapabacteria bacterium]HOQ48523.1 signal peptidase II [Candidatus Kapabacteria bacterium]HPP39894.1 signal peptidase II [Candidatus Kapabacteria bacterium]HPU22974.1 signal peptidase II [Candidatus Kapabacteria bacterium]